MYNFECVKILDFYVSRLMAIARKHKITLLRCFRTMKINY